MDKACAATKIWSHDDKMLMIVICVVGRYNKYCRHVSQTPWLVDGGKKTNTSIEEVICENANQHIKAKGDISTIHSSV